MDAQFSNPSSSLAKRLREHIVDQSTSTPTSEISTKKRRGGDMQEVSTKVRGAFTQPEFGITNVSSTSNEFRDSADKNSLRKANQQS